MNDSEPEVGQFESQRIRAQIRHVLLETWDPIGIKDEPNARDEYDGYIGRLYELLVSRAPNSDLIEHLYWAAHYNMGFDSACRSDMESTVQALRKIPLGPVD